jgi:hypothetical protein
MIYKTTPTKGNKMLTFVNTLLKEWISFKFKKIVNLFASRLFSLLYLGHNTQMGLSKNIKQKEIILAVLSAGGFHHYTPVQIQKLFFLIDKLVSKKIDGPFFNFIAYHYGPFDKQLYVLLEDLSNEGDVEISQFPSKYFTLTEKGLKLGINKLENIDKNEVDNIKKLNEFVCSLSFSELVSTIYKYFPEMKKNSVFNTN